MKNDYRSSVNQRNWEFQRSRFPECSEFFERSHAPDGRPPVFLSREAWRNVITDPVGSEKETKRVIAMVPERERHRWFRSMNSSQALAQSVFGNLATKRELVPMPLQFYRKWPRLPFYVGFISMC